MTNNSAIRDTLEQEGFVILNDVFTTQEVESLLRVIATADTSKPTFRKTSDLFAIRQFLKEVPGVTEAIFNSKLSEMIAESFGVDFFVVKSIYFDKPEQSNWFVAYHQDLTISVDKRIDVPGYGLDNEAKPICGATSIRVIKR